MQYLIMNRYNILTFNKKLYDKVINSIIDSRAYICYIDSQQNKGVQNKRYTKYLDNKEYYYLATSKEKKPDSIYSVIPKMEPDSELAITLGDKYGINDDYNYFKTISETDKGRGIIIHEIQLVERKILEYSLVTDDKLQSVDNNFLSDDFFKSSFRRFFLLPILIKHKGKYLNAQTILNVYKEGFLTVQIIIPFEIEDNYTPLSEETPIDIKFDDIYYYKLKEKYQIEDYWMKDRVNSENVTWITDYYVKLLGAITGVETFTKNDFYQTGWVLADFGPRQVDKNIKAKTISRYLLNSVEEVLLRKTNDNIKEILSKSCISHTNDYTVYCNQSCCLLDISNSLFSTPVEDRFKDTSSMLKKENIYDQEAMEFKKHLTYTSMFDFIRFYELTFIKKFFLKKLLIDISSKKHFNVKDYVKLKKELDFHFLKFDEDLIFNNEGSPKELYLNMLVNSRTNSLLEKCRKSLDSIREDISKEREVELKKTESFILCITSFLTVILSFEGISIIVKDIVSNLYKLGINVPVINWVSNHNLRATTLLWLIFILPILILVGNLLKKSFQ